MKEILLSILSSNKGTISSTRFVLILSIIIVIINTIIVDVHILYMSLNGYNINWEGVSMFLLSVISILIITGVVKYKQKKYEG